MHTYFRDLSIGQPFTTACGTPYIKKSTRTAAVGAKHPAHDGTNGPQRWFYFGQLEYAETEGGTVEAKV